MAGSSADGAVEPIGRKRPSSMSRACEGTLTADGAAALWFSRQTKKDRQGVKGLTHMEAKSMANEDEMATSRRRAEKAEETAAKLQLVILDLQAEIQAVQAAERPAAGACPEPRFSAGQSVLQWWASWFKEGTAKPKQYKKNKRPTWYSAEILNPAVYTKGMQYAGFRYVGWVYPTH